MSRGVPYCLVAASNRDAMFTLGDKYDASILNREPMAPEAEEEGGGSWETVDIRHCTRPRYAASPPSCVSPSTRA